MNGRWIFWNAAALALLLTAVIYDVGPIKAAFFLYLLVITTLTGIIYVYRRTPAGMEAVRLGREANRNKPAQLEYMLDLGFMCIFFGAGMYMTAALYGAVSWLSLTLYYGRD